MKNEFKIKNLPEPINLQDVATKNYVDNKNNSFVPINEFDNDTIVRTNKNNNFNGNTIIELDSVYVRSDPEFPLQLTPKRYVDLLIDNTSIIRRIGDRVPTNSKSVSVLEDPSEDLHLATKRYVDTHLNQLKIVFPSRVHYDTTIFSNNTGEDLWTGWTLEINEMNSLTGFF